MVSRRCRACPDDRAVDATASARPDPSAANPRAGRRGIGTRTTAAGEAHPSGPRHRGPDRDAKAARGVRGSVRAQAADLGRRHHAGGRGLSDRQIFDRFRAVVADRARDHGPVVRIRLDRRGGSRLAGGEPCPRSARPAGVVRRRHRHIVRLHPGGGESLSSRRSDHGLCRHGADDHRRRWPVAAVRRAERVAGAGRRAGRAGAGRIGHARYPPALGLSRPHCGRVVRPLPQPALDVAGRHGAGRRVRLGRGAAVRRRTRSRRYAGDRRLCPAPWYRAAADRLYRTSGRDGAARGKPGGLRATCRPRRTRRVRPVGVGTVRPAFGRARLVVAP